MIFDRYLGKERNVVIAYILFFTGGFMGLHKFYLEKLGMGVIYIVTGALFGLGWLYDLLTLPGQVAEFNRDNRHETTFFEWYNQRDDKWSPENQILAIAKRQQGMVTPMDLVIAMPISLEDARKQLEKMVANGYAEIEIDSQGRAVYKIVGL